VAPKGHSAYRVHRLRSRPAEVGRSLRRVRSVEHARGGSGGRAPRQGRPAGRRPLVRPHPPERVSHAESGRWKNRAR